MLIYYAAADCRVATAMSFLASPNVARASDPHLMNLQPPDDPIRSRATMYHLLEARDLTFAATFYADDGEPDAVVARATEVFAGRIGRAESDAAARMYEDLSAMLIDPKLPPALPGRLAHRLVFNLYDRLVRTAALQPRLDVLQPAATHSTTCRVSATMNLFGLRDLSVSHSKIGDVKFRMGDLAGALDAYRAGMATAERLTAQNTDDAVSRFDLSGAHHSLGNVKLEQGDVAGALEAYRAGHAIISRLLVTAPRSSPLLRSFQSATTRSATRCCDLTTSPGL
jgi:hypothetical protein